MPILLAVRTQFSTRSLKAKTGIAPEKLAKPEKDPWYAVPLTS